MVCKKEPISRDRWAFALLPKAPLSRRTYEELDSAFCITEIYHPGPSHFVIFFDLVTRMEITFDLTNMFFALCFWASELLKSEAAVGDWPSKPGEL